MPTNLHQPCPTTSSSRVLLLLGLQAHALTPPPAGVPAHTTLRANVERILSFARAGAPPPLIVHVRYSGGPCEPDALGSTGWQLVLPPRAHERVVDTRTGDAFTGAVSATTGAAGAGTGTGTGTTPTELRDLVPPTAEVVIVGQPSDGAVRATALAALERGNEVILIRGAHVARDRTETLGVTRAGMVEARTEAFLEGRGASVLEMGDVSQLFTNR